MLPPWKKGDSLRVIPASCPLLGGADLRRNQWPIYIGMGGRFGSEYTIGVYHRIYGEEIKLIVIVELWIMWVTGKLSTLSTAAFFRFFEKFDFAPEQVVENPLEE
jgi:hypothetical protein